MRSEHGGSSAVSTFVVFMVTLRRAKYKQKLLRHETKEDISQQLAAPLQGKESPPSGCILLTNFTPLCRNICKVE
jgi:hypothetical protein